MDHTPFTLPPSHEPVPPPPPWWKRITGPLVAFGVIILKYLSALKVFIIPVLKFFPLLLKTGGSMLFMMWIYAMMYGWQYAVGFVLLILVHECGHVIAAKRYGLNVSAPMFIPFFGALILLRERPKNAWIEAVMAIGGPVAGTVGAILCHNIYIQTHDPLFLALAYSGYFLNLFNLMPVGFLDGGRIVNAITPWLLIPGLAILAWFMIEYNFDFILLLIMLTSLPRIWRLFWTRTPEEEYYHALPVGKRITMGVCYFGLAAFLYYMMHTSFEELQSFGHGA